MPRILHSFLYKSFCYLYQDLRLGAEYLQRQPWIPLTLAQPLALLHDTPRGFELSEEDITPGISYADLARAMVQMAEGDGGGPRMGKGVGTIATGLKEMKDYTPLIWYNWRGLLAAYLPAWASL